MSAPNFLPKNAPAIMPNVSPYIQTASSRPRPSSTVSYNVTDRTVRRPKR